MTSFPLRLRASLSEQLGPCTCDEEYACRLCRTVARGVELHNSWRAARRKEALRIALELVRARSLTPEEVRLAKELDRFSLDEGDEAYDTACRAQGVRWTNAFPMRSP